MAAYWLLFLFPAVAAMAGGDRAPGMIKPAVSFNWVGYGLILFALVGLRYATGGDWNNYVAQLQDVAGRSLAEVIDLRDPGYKLLNWISLQMGWTLVGVNTMAAALFSVGLLSFCRHTPRPWLAVAVAVPYLIIVVGMGYTRQGIALGCAMLGLIGLQQRSAVRFAMWVLLGATFHRSAVLLLPIAALSLTKHRAWVTVWIGVVALVGYQALLERDIDELYLNYIEKEYRSQGALIRLAMNGAAAVLFLSLRKRFPLGPASRSLWTWMSLISVGLLAAYAVSPGSSAALDRLGLYLLPLQLVVFAGLPDVLGRGRGTAKWVMAVLAYYGVVLFVWLNFARNAFMWLPYRFFPLEVRF